MFASSGYSQANMPSQWYTQQPPTSWQPYAPRAPPPPPPGYNPGLWNKGSWGLHPQYQGMNPQMPGIKPTAWAASSAWGGRETEPVAVPKGDIAFPPKGPKPVPAGYYDTRLSDNGLGLSGMIPVEKKSDSTVKETLPSTPWIWHPRSLVSENEVPALSPRRDYIFQGQTSSRRSSEPAPPNIQPDTNRHPNTSVISGTSRASGSATSYASSGDPSQHSQDPNRRSSEYQRESTPDASRETRRNVSNHKAPEEAYARDLPLKPTFSPSIIRTPEQYHRRSSDGESVSLSRQSSLPPSAFARSSLSSVSFVPGQMSDEPNSTESISTGRKPSNLSRSSTEPVIRPAQGSNSEPSRVHVTDSQRQQWLANPETERRIKSARSQIFADDRRMTTRSATPSPPSHLASNPATPHQYYDSDEYRRTPLSVPEAPIQPPPHWTTRFRKGYWNRRGDHLTLDGYIVFAPPQFQNPPELREYPAFDDGYLSHLDEFKPFLPHRQEHAGSLPVQGRPAKYPYEQWVVYHYI